MESAAIMKCLGTVCKPSKTEMMDTLFKRQKL